MAHTRTWDETSPPNTQAVSQGAQRIREFKVDVRERMGIDHVWNIDVNTDGYHNKVTMPVQGADPTNLASAGILYTKDVSAKAELFFRDEDGDLVQLSAGGSQYLLTTANLWVMSQRIAEVVLTDAATIAVDADLSNTYRVTLGGNRTLAVPTNGGSGQVITIRFIQDGTGGRTLTLNASYRKPAGLNLTLSTAAAAEDIITFYNANGTWIAVAIIRDVKSTV